MQKRLLIWHHKDCALLEKKMRFYVTKKSYKKKSDVNFNPEDELKILGCLNSFTSEHMRQKKQITLKIAEEICGHRNKVGSFASLSDLKSVKGIGPGRFKEICEKFLSDSENLPEAKTTKYQEDKPIQHYISPHLNIEEFQAVSSVTTVAVCVDAIYFTTMSKELTVSSWSHILLNDSNIYKKTAPEILEKVLNIVEKLPRSSFYLFETKSTRKMSPAYTQMIIFVAQVQMALMALLNKDIGDIGHHKVYCINDAFTKKVFNLSVGGERVSGLHILKLIEDNQYSINVSIPSDLWTNFHALENVLYQERYSNCLLVALAFLQHVHAQQLNISSKEM